tara:strand:+ start:1253 stop:1492 length:240 start_codon:yes stop_codon:yes gene_type:complete
MKFIEIKENAKTVAGEYLFHEPTGQIVMCASYNRGRNQIVALAGSRMFTDTINSFKKIELSIKEKSERLARRRCRSCGR